MTTKCPFVISTNNHRYRNDIGMSVNEDQREMAHAFSLPSTVPWILVFTKGLGGYQASLTPVSTCDRKTINDDSGNGTMLYGSLPNIGTQIIWRVITPVANGTRGSFDYSPLVGRSRVRVECSWVSKLPSVPTKRTI